MTVFSPEAVRAMVAPVRMTVLARLPTSPPRDDPAVVMRSLVAVFTDFDASGQ